MDLAHLGIGHKGYPYGESLHVCVWGGGSDVDMSIMTIMQITYFFATYAMMQVHSCVTCPVESQILSFLYSGLMHPMDGALQLKLEV